MRCAGLIVDDSTHYIDHLAPFCGLMGWPLIVCEREIAETIERFYPGVQVVLMDFRSLQLPPCIAACETRDILNAYLGPFRPYQGRLLWLPHGLSDKGWKTPFFEALKGEDLLLVYGQRMRDVLSQKGVAIEQRSIGNFRLQYYEQHRSFYNQLTQKLWGDRRFVLYAPTWEDAEQNGTFWQALPKLKNKSVMIRVHPNTSKRYAVQLEQHRGSYEFLENFPPVYPVLERTDVYLGDMSSIGYDFLTFNKPLYFLRQTKTDPHLDPSAFLMRAGTQLEINELEQMENTPQSHETLYNHAFDKTSNWMEQVESWLAAH